VRFVELTGQVGDEPLRPFEIALEPLVEHSEFIDASAEVGGAELVELLAEVAAAASTPQSLPTSASTSPTTADGNLVKEPGSQFVFVTP
jgi:hypothetical protein